MNNYEWLKTASIEDVSHYLCEQQYEACECHNCPHFNRCFPNGCKSHNGYMNWLQEEH